MVVGAAQLLGGCAFQLGSLSGNSKPAPELVTGSVTPAVAQANASVDTPSEADLAYARAAASDVLAKGGKDASQPWENPQTGARGSVTPLTNAYSVNGTTCRDFLASYVKDKVETWLQGEACKYNAGWEVRSMKPWRKA